MTLIKKEVQYGQHILTLETGEIARQASSVIATVGDTIVMANVTFRNAASPGQSFFPLTVDYVEKTYAAGKVPGGFFKRETRPSEKATLTSRLIDRALRPMFADGFVNETQVVVSVLSLDPEIPADIPALIAASAAVAISGLPLTDRVAAVRVGYEDGNYFLPDTSQMETSKLDLVVAGSSSSVVMVESEADKLSEEIMLGALDFGHAELRPIVRCIEEMAAAVATPPFEWSPPVADSDVQSAIKEDCFGQLTEAYCIPEKVKRNTQLGVVRSGVVDRFLNEQQDNGEHILSIVKELEHEVVRNQVLDGSPRIDGRTTREVRPISIKTGILPRCHGSALFTRGETQAIVVTTLGSARDAQIVDSLEGESREEFMLHYNFPPYCVGETGRMGPTKRRELGHGRLAKRALAPVVPDGETFPYVIRVVSEITESNGSSSMASVCGGTLSMMDAGVPIDAPVAGIAMGLIMDSNRFAILSDILGDEDHLGDMDFKVAGTADGVTALQMDIKVSGISTDILAAALDQAKEGRLHILNEMNKALPEPRDMMSEHAPRVESVQVNPEKIRDVIGKGGATIRGITEATGATIDIDDDGLIKIFSPNAESVREARRQIELITADIEVDKVYEGTVVKLMDFGAFVSLGPGRDGLVHISQISEERVEKVSDKLSEGEKVNVRVLEIDKQGRIRLSIKAV